MSSQTVIEQPLGTSTLFEDTTRSERSGPRENFEIEENQDGRSEEDDTYPSGPKLWLTMTSLCITSFLSGLVSSLTMYNLQYFYLFRVQQRETRS
jgi:hypothetical protein